MWDLPSGQEPKRPKTLKLVDAYGIKKNQIPQGEKHCLKVKAASLGKIIWESPIIGRYSGEFAKSTDTTTQENCYYSVRTSLAFCSLFSQYSATHGFTTFGAL
jgi:hypothetical protein